jgi:hypothetical protein
MQNKASTSGDGSRILPVRGRVPGWIVSVNVISVVLFFFFCSPAPINPLTGKERIARDEEKTPQAPRQERTSTVSPSTTLVDGSRVSTSTDDTT